MRSLILGSGSARREELLRQLGLIFQVLSPKIDEAVDPGESAHHYVSRMSRQKFEFTRSHQRVANADIVICADTVVVFKDQILCKPLHREDGIEMLQRLSGQSHQVLTGVRVGTSLNSSKTFCVETIVKFRTLKLQDCEAYWLTNEPQDKAGGYAIQGLGAIFVDCITGSYSNVVGLPLKETAEALLHFGISILDLNRESYETN